MNENENDSPLNSLPINMDWVSELDERVRPRVFEILNEFNSATIYLGQAINHSSHDSVQHQDAHCILGLTGAMTHATMIISLMETMKNGAVGLDSEVLGTVSRSIWGAMLLAGIRYGQNHPDDFLSGDLDLHDAGEELARLLNGLGQAETEEGNEEH